MRNRFGSLGKLSKDRSRHKDSGSAVRIIGRRRHFGRFGGCLACCLPCGGCGVFFAVFGGLRMCVQYLVRLGNPQTKMCFSYIVIRDNTHIQGTGVGINYASNSNTHDFA